MSGNAVGSRRAAGKRVPMSDGSVLPELPATYWSRSANELLRALEARSEGLTSLEADRRLNSFGPNLASEMSVIKPLRLLIRQFSSPLVLILVVGAIVSFVIREWTDATIILLIILGSALLGFFQEYGASRAVESLRGRLAHKAKILRDGAVQRLDSEAIVPGDIVVLSAGDLVPADGVALDAVNLITIEAALTGESLPVEKSAMPVPTDTPMPLRTNCLFLGTSVRSGTARMLVVNTGKSTALGTIASRLEAEAPETEFARGLRGFGYLLVRIMIGISAAVIVVRLVAASDPIESLMFAVALAVGLSPELLPAIVSVTVAAGARAMARHGVIVRRLESIENLGSIDILCTDKTGTLTEGVISLSAAVDALGRPSHDVVRDAVVNAALQSGMDNPLDTAIVASGKAASMAPLPQKLGEVPYDFARKRLTVIVADGEQQAIAITKGAFDKVLEVCTSIAGPGGTTPIGAAERKRLGAFCASKGAEGFRVLGLARRSASQAEFSGSEIEAEMTFTGFLLFFDPPKADVTKSLRGLRHLGIHLKIISGDNRFVSRHIAEAIGIPHEEVLTGQEIDRLDPAELAHRATNVSIFAEILPEQKERIVRALQDCGHAVGYMGDGINDALALKAADVGISVESAVDVARESASIVLLRRDLEALRQGVVDGRRTFANTMKYINITTSANFGNMVSMAIATLFLPFLPLTATQILLNNFLSDLPAVAIASDNVDSAQTRTAQRWQVAQISRFMWVFGLISTVFDLTAFLVLLNVFGASEQIFRTAWFVLSMLTELTVVFILRTHGPVLKSRSSSFLFWTSLAVAVSAVVLPFSGPVGATFGLAPVPWTMLGAMLLILLLYLAATELAKRAFYRHRRPHGR